MAIKAKKSLHFHGCKVLTAIIKTSLGRKKLLSHKTILAEPALNIYVRLESFRITSLDNKYLDEDTFLIISL